MKPSSLLILLPFLLVFIACAKKSELQETTDEQPRFKNYEESKTDKNNMVYGLACDDCTDSILVFLPDSGGDPVKFYIFDAWSEGKVFGRPEVGDRMALLLGPKDSLVVIGKDSLRRVLLSVNMEKVKGTWYYEEMPELQLNIPTRNADEMGKEERAKLQQIRDSFINAEMVPREYVYTLKRDYTVRPEGGPPRTSSLDRKKPVVYPPLKRYREWHLHNGKIIFSYNVRDTLNTDSTVWVNKNDTAEFVLLRRDTMALRFGDRVQGFKLKPDSLTEKRN